MWVLYAPGMPVDREESDRFALTELAKDALGSFFPLE